MYGGNKHNVLRAAWPGLPTPFSVRLLERNSRGRPTPAVQAWDSEVGAGIKIFRVFWGSFEFPA